MCGGKGGVDIRIYCYTFKDQIWLLTGDMTTKRRAAGSVLLNDTHWWISGGGI